ETDRLRVVIEHRSAKTRKGVGPDTAGELEIGVDRGRGNAWEPKGTGRRRTHGPILIDPRAPRPRKADLALPSAWPKEVLHRKSRQAAMAEIVIDRLVTGAYREFPWLHLV